jgi:glucosamine--fructose-6-phosphate aminotransferase (isomerizing)
MSKHGEIMTSEISETPDVFAKLISADLFSKELIGLLDSAKIKSVLILARGTSDNAAHFLKYLVETQLGLPCGLTSPSSVSIYNSKLKYENALVVAISQSGKSTDLVEFAKAAKNAGAKLVSMTNDANSPLAVSADFHISLQAGPELAVAATKSYSAQLLISYLLVMAWSGKKAFTQKLVSEAREVFSNRSEITKVAQSIDLSHQLVVLGRGFAYPNAKEAALKIQETCKVNVHGMSTADYQHGPISALDENSQVILIAPCCMPSNSMGEAVEKIRKITKKIYWIGRGADVAEGEFNLGGSCCEDEITSSIVDAMILQELALNLSVIRGLNPDAPAGLSKVTMTI